MSTSGYFKRCGVGRWPRVPAERCPVTRAGDYAVVFLSEAGHKTNRSWVRAGRLYEFTHSMAAVQHGEINDDGELIDGPGACRFTVFSATGRAHPNIQQWIELGLLDGVVASREYTVALNSAGNWIRGTGKIEQVSQLGEQVLRISIAQADFKLGGGL